MTLNADPDHEAQSQYSFSVVTTDAAGNVSDAQSVTLDINDLDDAAPTITSGDTADTINENSGAGQLFILHLPMILVMILLMVRLPQSC